MLMGISVLYIMGVLITVEHSETEIRQVKAEIQSNAENSKKSPKERLKSRGNQVKRLVLNAQGFPPKNSVSPA